MKFLYVVSFLVLFLIPFSVSAEEGCVSLHCHSGMLKASNLHAPVHTCLVCHTMTGQKHPLKGKRTTSIVMDIPNLCNNCHPKEDNIKNLHLPFKNGMCTGCHNPHESNERSLLKQPPAILCTGCHPDLLTGKLLHGPASSDCLFCHKAHSSENPKILSIKEPDVCLNCHNEISEEFKKRSIHPALFSGCSSCHNPHSSEFRKFLRTEGEKLCFTCHPAIEERLKKAISIHQPIKQESACSSCHLPHSSNGAKLMESSGSELCLGCHRDFINKKKYKFLHGPIAQKDCTSSCHEPHGTSYRKLLINDFPEAFYISYTENSYELCFSCHKRELLKYPDTTFATGFRDGNKNLHYTHVNRKDKSRNCKFCHVIHAGNNPKLITEKVKFGNWDLPIGFSQTDTGGSCAPGCHRKFTYDRKKAIQK